MAGDEEVKAVALALAKLHGDRPKHATQEWGNRARVAIAALDRVRSRPTRSPAGSTTGGTESEDHEAVRGKAARAIDPEAFEAPILVPYRERAFKAADAAIAVIEAERALFPVGGTQGEDHEAVWVIYTDGSPEPTDVISEREEGDTLPNEKAVRYVPAPSPVSGTEPDTAKLMEALRVAELYVRENRVKGRDAVQDHALVRAALAGFSVDAGKPCPEPLPEPQSVKDYKAMVSASGFRALIPYVHRQTGFATHNCDFEECQIEGCPTLRSLLSSTMREAGPDGR